MNFKTLAISLAVLIFLNNCGGGGSITKKEDLPQQQTTLTLTVDNLTLDSHSTLSRVTKEVTETALQENLSLVSISSNDSTADFSLSGTDAHLFQLSIDDSNTMKLEFDHLVVAGSYDVDIIAKSVHKNETVTYKLRYKVLPENFSLMVGDIEEEVNTTPSRRGIEITTDTAFLMNIRTNKTATTTLEGRDSSLFTITDDQLTFKSAPSVGTYEVDIKAVSSDNETVIIQLAIDVVLDALSNNLHDSNYTTTATASDIINEDDVFAPNIKTLQFAGNIFKENSKAQLSSIAENRMFSFNVTWDSIYGEYIYFGFINQTQLDTNMTTHSLVFENNDILRNNLEVNCRMEGEYQYSCKGTNIDDSPYYTNFTLPMDAFFRVLICNDDVDINGTKCSQALLPVTFKD